MCACTYPRANGSRCGVSSAPTSGCGVRPGPDCQAARVSVGPLAMGECGSVGIGERGSVGYRLVWVG
eukprot:166705-Prorocentrum_lima.AAC.1